MGWIIFWCVCGLISAAIASGKGRSGGGWFVIGLLLGPVGVILAIVTSKNEDGIVEQGKQKKCLFCAELIKSEAILCKHCGKNQNTDDTCLKISPENINHKALQVAISNGELEKVRLIIEAGLELDKNDQSIDHLDYAEMYKNQAIIDLIRSKISQQSN